MDRIEYLADLTVKRGCGFALLAIGTVSEALLPSTHTTPCTGK